MTWHKVMEVAHQGVTPIQLPGLGNRTPPKRDIPVAAANTPNPAINRPNTLSPRAIEQLLKLERSFRAAGGTAALLPAGPTNN
jgi:hypothetical protein